MMDRLTSIDELAKLIPDVIETEQSHVGLLWGERVKIAEAILDKCVVIQKGAKMWEPEYHTKVVTTATQMQFTTNEKGIGEEFVKCTDCIYSTFSDFELECGKGYKGIVNRNDGCTKGRKDFKEVIANDGN